MGHQDQKVAMVTGAGGGIGRQIALRLARDGYHIAILEVNAEAARWTARSVERTGRRAAFVEADVTDYTQVHQGIDKLATEFGRIHVLVNNAGILHISRLADTSLDDWRRTFAVNVDGTFHVCKAGIQCLDHDALRRIINIASWFGKTGKPFYAAYCASKFAVIGITQSLAQELAEQGVTVNAVCPGTIADTDMRGYADEVSSQFGIPTAAEREKDIPLGRLGRPEDIAKVVSFLASEDAAYMTGQAINVTGGQWMH